MKEKLKQLWEGIKKRDPRSLLFLALICAIPVFLYSILGSILFGITLSGDDVVIHILLAPLYLIFAYFFIDYFIYVMIYGWIIKPLIKRKK